MKPAIAPTRRWSVAATLLAALAASACGEPAGFPLHGARVVVESDVPFAHQADFPARIESTAEAALGYWGGTWRNLDGVTIDLTSAQYVACGGRSALACWDGDIRMSTSDPGAGPFACVEQTLLVHEIGHAVLGDPSHLDPRWMQFDAVQAALAGRTGYAGTGQVDCVLYPSVWRHPLGSP